MTVVTPMRFPPPQIPPNSFKCFKDLSFLLHLSEQTLPFSESLNPKNSLSIIFPVLVLLLHWHPMSTISKDTHIVVVDVPATSDEEVLTTTSLEKAIEHHPLTEISGSPGHLLLLKLWQREEDLSSRRATAIESRLDASKRDAFLLSSLFLAFHAISLTILFSSAHKSDENNICRIWMVPSFLSLITSLVIVSSVQAIICAYWRGWKELQRERVDARALTRCLQELRMKGASFDLSREPQAVRRAKSSSVEVKWHGPLRWFSRNLVTVFLLCVSGLIATASKFIICS